MTGAIKLTYVDEIKTQKDAISYVQENSKLFGKVIATELDEKLQEFLPIYDAANLDNIFDSKVSIEDLICNAADDNDNMIIAASMIYRRVYKNWIEKYNLWNEKGEFLIEYREYLTIAVNAQMRNVIYYLRLDKKRDEPIFVPIVHKCDLNGNPEIVEMIPYVRFIKAGFNPVEAHSASVFWSTINRLMHVSEDNNRKISELLVEVRATLKEHMLAGVKFFKAKGIY